jgi:hypothetical protein
VVVRDRPWQGRSGRHHTLLTSSRAPWSVAQKWPSEVSTSCVGSGRGHVCRRHVAGPKSGHGARATTGRGDGSPPGTWLRWRTRNPRKSQGCAGPPAHRSTGPGLPGRRPYNTKARGPDPVVNRLRRGQSRPVWSRIWSRVALWPPKWASATHPGAPRKNTNWREAELALGDPACHDKGRLARVASYGRWRRMGILMSLTVCRARSSCSASAELLDHGARDGLGTAGVLPVISRPFSTT